MSRASRIARIKLEVRRTYSSGVSAHDVQSRLRSLLRETAQPVAVVTSHMPRRAKAESAFHGATLSSFTSVALSPHPLVAFSLRVPSRMAESLSDLATSNAPGAHMVINLLSAPQAHLATLFSRADLHPRPFDNPRAPWSLSPSSGLPVLHGSLGTLECRVIAPPFCLRDLTDDSAEASAPDGIESELFIARVLRVEDAPLPTEAQGQEDAWRLPLLYHRRGYGTIASHLPGPPSPTSKAR